MRAPRRHPCPAERLWSAFEAKIRARRAFAELPDDADPSPALMAVADATLDFVTLQATLQREVTP